MKILVALAGIALCGCSLMSPPPAAIATASSVPLLDTHWRLSQLGERVIDNPAGQGDVHIVLASRDSGVTGNSGCNRMFGRYALENDMLKFDGLGGTKMFCEARMELEQSFTNTLLATMRWKITGQTLQLLDETGKPVASFVAGP